jgi:hypothetical protein
MSSPIPFSCTPQPLHGDSHDVVMADEAVPGNVIQGGVADVDHVVVPVSPPPSPDDVVMVHGAPPPPVMVDSAVPENGNVSVRLENVFTSHHIVYV